MTLILTGKKETAMKKILFMMSLSALAFVSCQKSEIEEAASPAGQNTYTFVVNNVSETKATIGDKNATQWPVLWAAGDQIGVYGGGQLLGVATLDEGSAGSNRGNFTLTTDATLSAGDELYFSYPYVEGAQMKTGKVAEKHTLTASGIGANGVAYAYVDYAGPNTEFTLTHLNAYLKFNLSSSEFAGYSLQGITLWAKETKLSGGVEVGDGDAVTYTGAGDYVKTTLATPAEMGTAAQSVYVSTLPADLTGKEVYAIVHMTKGIETVTIPVKINGAGNIPAGSVTEVTLPALTKSLAPAWYEPVETRYIAAYGEGWSYGPENTVLFTEDGQEKVVELKARGNFMKVKQPAKVKINNVSDQNGAVAERVYINDVDGNNKTSVDLDANCSVKVKMKVNSSAGYCSSMLVQDKDGKTIWGINLWLSHDGVQTAAYDNGTVMDRNIGSSKVSSVKKHYTCNGVYFQWGRPFGFPWSTTDKGTTYASTTEENTLERSAENPFTMFTYVGGSNNGPGYPWDWYWGDGSNKDRSGDLDDLWGNPNTNAPVLTESGIKSNYDPCPKGYRVASAAIIEELNSNIQGEMSGTTFVSSGPAVVYTDNTTLHYVVYKGISWGFHGLFAPTTGMNKIDNAKTGTISFWSNANHDSNGHHLYFRINGAKLERVAKRTKCAATPIRCMVDTENR